MKRQTILLAASLLVSACGDPGGSAGLRDLDAAELQVLAEAGDTAAGEELMRRAVEAGQAELDDMKSAAAAGDPKAAYQDAYLKGDAAAIAELAADGNVYAIFGQAMQKAASDDADLAASGRADAIRAAEGGNADAALWVGRGMAQGLSGFDYQPAEGLRWVEAAAEAGNAEAMFTAGQLYQSGAQPDLAKARLWYTRALDAGITPAATALEQLDAS